MKKKEFKIGETFMCGLVKLECIESERNCMRCDSCFFSDCANCFDIISECSKIRREDRTDVIFVKVEE